MKKALAWIAISVACVLALGTWGVRELTSRPAIVDLDPVSLKQFLWASNDLIDKPFPELLARNDPLQAVWAVWLNFYRSKDATEATKRLDAIISKYDLTRTAKMQYDFGHGSLKPGWWSGMDMFFMPLTLVSVAEKTGNEKYVDLAKKMLDVALKSPVDGGSMWPDEGKGCWLSEYSWSGMTRDDEYYVLNGHLFALTALKILADDLSSLRLQTAFDCATTGTANLADRFHKATKWPLYMLHEPTIDPAHYLLYEMLQFAGLYKLTGNEFFHQQEVHRSEVFSRNYPVYLVDGRDDKKVFFSSSGNPHPYNLDIFQIALNCWNKDDRDYSVTYWTEIKRGFSRAAFAIGPAPKNPICAVVSNYMGQSFELFRTRWFREVNSDDDAATIAAPVTPTLDAAWGDGGWVRIDPKVTSSPNGVPSYLDDEARLTMSFPRRSFTDAAIISLEVEANSPLRIGIRLHDGDKTIQRYLLPLSAGSKQIVSFSKLGFEHADDFDSIDGATFVIFTDTMSSPADVRIDRLSIAENQYEFYRSIQKSDGTMLMEK